MQVTFGKYKGKNVTDLPTDYLEWGAANLTLEKFKEAFQKELYKRENDGKEEYKEIDIDYNELIFGKDKTEKIVNVTVENDKVYIYKSDNTSEVYDYQPWVLSNLPSANRKAERLKGNQYYKYITTVSTNDFRRLTKERPRGLWFARSIEEAFMLEQGVTYFKGLKPSDLSLLSFDIEATSLNPDDENAEVILISNTYRDRDGNITRKLFDIKSYENDSEMLSDWELWVQEQNPDVILGHNIFGYDLPYICAQQNVALGRDGSVVEFNERASKFRKDGSQQYEYFNAKIHGRELIDTMFLSIKYDLSRDFPSYGLKQIEKHLNLVKNRTNWDFDKYKPKYYKTWSDEKWQEFKNYCNEDADTPIKLFDLMIPAFFYLNQSVPKTLQQMINEASGSQLDSLMIRAYLQEGYSQPKTSKKVEFEGAISMGIPGVYKNVRKVDVASLYPSIMLEQDIYDKRKDPKRYMLQILEYFREERLKNKALAKETNNTYYDDLQSAQKIVINSMYGFLAANYLLYNYPEGAKAVTKRGREILQTGVKWACGFELVEEVKSIKNKGKPNEEVKTHWVPGEKTSDGKGYQLVNVDTDSFSYTDGTIPDNDVFSDEINELNSLYSDYIRWENDGIFDQVIVVKAKNYVLKNGDKIKYKGSSLTDQKKEPILLEFLEKIIGTILTNDMDLIPELYRQHCLEALRFSNPKEWCVKKTITKAVLNPERANEQKPLDACNQAIEKGIIPGIQEGDKIYLYQAIDGEKQKVAKGEPVFLKDGTPKMELNTILKFPELYDNDHDQWHYVKRVYNTLNILENVIDMGNIIKYHNKSNHSKLVENVDT